MLRVLELRDFAIAASVTLELEPGFNVLSGETGAGKSIVVDALSLLAGGRPDAGQIRAGAESAVVQGEFEGTQVSSAARRLVESGRHTARLDGELVTVAELAERAGALIAVYAQGSAQELQSPASQRTRLDCLLPPAAREVLVEHGVAFGRLAQVTAELDALRQREREAARRQDTLERELGEIDAVKLRAGEDTALAADLDQLQHAERITLGAATALGALSDGEPGAIALVSLAAKELSGAARHAPALAPLAQELSDSLSGLGAIAGELETFLAGFEVDPARLDAVQSRLARLEALKRKYGPGLTDVTAYRASLAAELEGLADLGDVISRLETEAAGLSAETDRLAVRLSEARREAGERLALAMPLLLAELGLPHARFEVRLTPSRQPAAHGRDQVSFEFSANRGEPLGRLADVASGGEMSRLMLALHLLTGSEHPTLVFDEVDAGIGGATAQAVGRLLKRLSSGRQVLVVTHLAQVAAFADAHFVVGKREDGPRTVAEVTRLGAGERPKELARMLSGSVTDASLRHAEELMSAAEHIN